MGSRWKKTSKRKARRTRKKQSQSYHRRRYHHKQLGGLKKDLFGTSFPAIKPETTIEFFNTCMSHWLEQKKKNPDYDFEKATAPQPDGWTGLTEFVRAAIALSPDKSDLSITFNQLDDTELQTLRKALVDLFDLFRDKPPTTGEQLYEMIKGFSYKNWPETSRQRVEITKRQSNMDPKLLLTDMNVIDQSSWRPKWRQLDDFLYTIRHPTQKNKVVYRKIIDSAQDDKKI